MDETCRITPWFLSSFSPVISLNNYEKAKCHEYKTTLRCFEAKRILFANTQSLFSSPSQSVFFIRPRHLWIHRFQLWDEVMDKWRSEKKSSRVKGQEEMWRGWEAERGRWVQGQDLSFNKRRLNLIRMNQMFLWSSSKQTLMLQTNSELN